MKEGGGRYCYSNDKRRKKQHRSKSSIGKVKGDKGFGIRSSEESKVALTLHLIYIRDFLIQLIPFTLIPGL